MQTRNGAPFIIGQRVELNPATDAWMMGDRFGEVVKVGRSLIHIRMDRSGKVRRVRPSDVFITY